MQPTVHFQDLGLIDYQEAWDYQEKLFAKTVALKIANRNADTLIPTENYLLFCEHPHVFTLGKSGKESHLLLNESGLKENEATYYKINRGGDITYHGPGQLIGYPIFDLEYFFSDIHKYMRFLEESVILTLQEFGIVGGRVAGLTGVWIDFESNHPRKICAMGVKSSRWVTMHGIGFNVNSNLNYFNFIVPCGIDDKAVTSMEKELGAPVDMDKVKSVLKEKMAQQFGYQYA
ncbi:MAG: lipoyl(octanoyl) transferase LipB [Crocinitomicaceae bacterium]